MTIKIAIIGEYHENFLPHTSINQAMEDLSHFMNVNIDYDWIETTDLISNPSAVLKPYQGIWSAPGSPFKSLDGALNAIQYARENNVPHLGTCAGFQHAVIEIARNMLSIKDASHEEYPEESSSHLFISKLVCSLAGKTMAVRIQAHSKAFDAYQTKDVNENYYCNFGINPGILNQLQHPDLIFSGVDQDGEIRILELKHLDYFVATLFVPQSRSTREKPHPLIRDFIAAAMTQ
ncbi:MAG: hypothetical protein PWP51_916 [Clostridiales bacterium]|jgi:CTP synthase (UTP-ammonia lyase)|nr:hypothetical protein [Clostridiales bacterium]MDN5298363.1 hypothetical protein [Clostridiales bacterium]